MRLSSIARGSVRRHLSRTLLLTLVIAVTVGVVTTLYLVTRSADRDLADQVDEYGANIVVVPRSEGLPLSYGGVNLGTESRPVEPLHLSDIGVIRGIEEARNINLIAPKLLESAEVRGEEVLVVGVSWPEELALKRWWNIQGEEPEGEADVLAGARAAERLSLAVGDPLDVRGEEFRVVGILEETGGQEDDLLFASLSTVQRLWSRGDEVSFFEVSAYCSTCPIELINAQISAELPQARVSAVLKAAESREILIGQFRLFSVVLSVLMIGAGGLIVLATTLGHVRARRREIGVFRSLGYRRRHIFSIILLENLLLAFAGGTAGVVAALLAHAPVAVRLAGVRSLLAPGPVELAAVLGLSLAAVALATLYPAWRASRLSPTLALREV